MSRLVLHTDNDPVEVKIGDKSAWICRCGLSKKAPYCDGSHRACAEEAGGKVYRYENGQRVEVQP